ncbi:unnamed protein product [Adineta ricciae]|uniref:Uncharacterized protein n=1 Tax=Adineta ricciae TaxID=249248 RepID=A0A816EAV8_ADIRI|nr:unnamed protein product [Adineta ricciae]
MAVFFACFCSNSSSDKEANEFIDENQIDLEDDEDHLHSPKDYSLVDCQSLKRVNRLTESELIYARDNRLKELEMWSILRQFSRHIVFAILIFLVTYSNHQQNSFFQVNHLRKYLLHPGEVDHDFTQISTINHFWDWLTNTFVIDSRVQSWYNGDKPLYLNGFLNDKTNRLIGLITIRQLRVQSTLCDNQRIVSLCENDYNYFNEEKRSFSPGWTNETNGEIFLSSIINAFHYSTSDQLDGSIFSGEYATYGGGGYVYQFRGSLAEIQTNLSLLHQLQWINQHTRAVFIQFTLYNPNVQLLISVILLVEFLSTSGAFPSVDFQPINFYALRSNLQLVCVILYTLFLIYLMIIEIQLIVRLKSKYLKKFWSWIQLSIIGCSWTSVVIYVCRSREVSRLSKFFSETNGFVYINLQFAAHLNEILTILFGYCCFCSIIKFLDLLRVNQYVGLFVETIKSCRKDLLSFLSMFSIIYMAFLSLFYLLFISKISSCSSLISTAEMLFEMTTLLYDLTEITQDGSSLIQFCFTLFIFIVVFVCLSMFLSIIIQSFQNCQQNQHSTDETIFSFMIKRFFRYIGLNKPSQSEIQQDKDRRMRSLYISHIDTLRYKVDQLVSAINKVYMDQKCELSKLDKAGV